MACTQSPFADYDLPRAVIEATSSCSSMARRSFTCKSDSNSSFAGLQRKSMPVPTSKMDLDALIAASACKPGYKQPLQDTYPATVAAANPVAARKAAADVECAAAVSAVLQEYDAIPIPAGCNSGIAQAALDAIAQDNLSDTFYVYDLGEVARLHKTWVSTMPRVTPFYAVKCNPEPGVIATLNALGAGFDCASIQELKDAAVHDVPQSRIIFANPCKRPADFRYAAEHGVEYTTFDCASELEKIAARYPAFKCVLRIRCDDPEAKINLGLKYGADLNDVPELLAMAKNLGLQVVGVSFHVGSGCQNVGVYAEAIYAARHAFNLAAAAGFNMELLDIGGGFTAPYDEATGRLFYMTAGVINGALATHFPPQCGVRIIAEPGRYFAETCATLFTTILGQRHSRTADGAAFRDYWLSDSTYGSFRIQVAVDGLEPNYSVLRNPLLPAPTAVENGELLACRLWGNSSQDADVVHKAALLPSLRDGDWLMFPYAGAYTICAASNYGGVLFTRAQKVFVYSSECVREYGTYDVAAGAAAAADACRLVVRRCGSIGVVERKEGVTSTDSGELLPCLELLQGSAVVAPVAADAVTFHHGLTEVGGSVVDLESLDGMRVITSVSGGGVSPEPDAPVTVGSSDMDCMSVASEGTCIGCGGVELEVSSDAAAAAVTDMVV